MKKTKSRNKRMSRGRGLLTRVMMTGLCILLVTGTGANTVRFTAHASESEDPGASAQVYETDAAEDSVLPPAEDETPSDAGEPLPAEETAPTGEETPPPAEERTPSAEDETPSDAGEPLPAEENPLPADGGPLPAEEEPLPAGEDLSADPEAAIAEEEAVEYVMEIAEITESVQPAMAAGTGGVYNKLMSLKSKFPHDKYWNHSVPSHEAYTNCAHEGYADTVTSAPCASHNALAGTSQHDCNYFDGGWQCCGFARKVFYDVFGERESSNSLRRIYDPNGIRVGDYVKFTWEHYAVVLSVSDTTFTVVECNLADSGAAYNCKIRWGHTYRKNQIEYYVHSNRYDEVNGSSQTAPVQPANPARPAIVNWGNDFYAYIINCGTDNRWIHTMYGNNGMELAAKPQYTPRQIWHFMRQEDGSYTIQNEYNGHYLMLDGNANRTVPGFHRYNSGTKTQKWYIIENGPYKGIINKSLYDQNVMRVLDVDNAATAAGTKLHIFDRNGTVAQSFNI
ncbi:MAG: RICIN domain-containing protein, partial [Lachnospiraceae bacterium]|nr:RICIN domain-containing protein [Lachnospiraceae bacterium]